MSKVPGQPGAEPVLRQILHECEGEWESGLYGGRYRLLPAPSNEDPRFGE